MKASDAIALLLAENNFNYAFELIGGMITHVVDSIGMLGRTKVVSMRHEQGAAFAAAGACRAGNQKTYALALGTSGPGATNLITGIADCWLDNIPCLFITGQVNTYEQKGDRRIRQQGFQELEIVELVKSITKYAVKISKVEDLLPEIHKAIAISREGRNGPVLVDIPMDLQRVEIADDSVERALRNKINALPIASSFWQSDEQINLLQALVLNSKKPLVLMGGGMRDSACLNKFIGTLQENLIPYVASLRGAENIPSSANYLGMVGSYGTRAANKAVQTCDLLIVLGSRLDVRQTGANVKDFAREAKIIHVDIDPHQLNNTISAELAIEANIDDVIPVLESTLSKPELDKDWLLSLQKHYVASFKDEYSDWSISPFALIQAINEVFKDIRVQYVADVGNNQMWAAHTLTLREYQAAHYSGGLGAMGFALPAAIGVQLASSSPTVVITGDGGVQLNIQELDVIARENLPILILVLNNRTLGMVRNFQEMYFEGRNQTTFWDGHTCSFAGVAAGYGVESYLVNDFVEVQERLESFVAKPRPLLLEIEMLGANECRPRLAYGCSLDNQFPNFNAGDIS